MNKNRKILIIKHGAFGDIIKALPALYALHQFYKTNEISLLTDARFPDLHQQFFSYHRIFIDDRSNNLFKTVSLLKNIQAQQFDLIIDLQNSQRTNRYFYILKYLLINKAAWSGTAKGSDYYIPYNYKKTLHTHDRFIKQLTQLGIDWPCVPPQFLKTQTLNIQLPDNFVLIIPGCSSRSPEKKWDFENYYAVIKYLKEHHIESVVIGGPEENELSSKLAKNYPFIVNLINRVSVQDIITIAMHAKMIIGNDTGPLYLAQLAGQPICVLWSNHSNYYLHGPRGKNIHILQHNDINKIKPNDVIRVISPYIQ